MLSPKQRPDIKLETELSTDVGNIKADTAQLEMVLSAILTNASEALDDEGQIRVKTFEKDVDDVAAGAYPGMKPGRYVVLCITDNGKGMEEETKARIFEPFFSTKFQGRGLGMAAAYGIVKNHGGYIYIDSAPGNGTTVSIFLPEETDER
jgi:signal transduction histidine kinase